MTVAYTSAAAYQEHMASGKLGKQAQMILDAMRPGVNYSRRELVQITGLELSSVCGRVNELLQIGMLHDAAPRKCGITKKTITPVCRS